MYSPLLVSASTGVLSATEVSRLRPRTSAVTIASAESGPGLRAPALPVLISDPRLAVDVYFLAGWLSSRHQAAPGPRANWPSNGQSLYQ